jgi:microcystin-dependent protein
MEAYLGEIKMFAGNFAPQGFAFCNGQILPIAQNTALFSLLGTTYGGNGQTTFALPNLQCRFPMHPGNGAGLTPKVLGQTAGEEAVTLLTTQMPMHNHMVSAGNGQGGNASTPQNNFNGVYVDPNTGSAADSYSTSAATTMSPTAISTAGGSQPHDNMPPYQCINFIIALEGIYPSRS